MEGVSEVLAKASEGAETFLKQLQPTIFATNFLGPPEDSGGSVTFFSILKAARFLPPETAILLFTQHRAEDEDLVQLATKELKRQRIKVDTREISPSDPKKGSSSFSRT